MSINTLVVIFNFYNIYWKFLSCYQARSSRRDNNNIYIQYIVISICTCITYHLVYTFVWQSPSPVNLKR